MLQSSIAINGKFYVWESTMESAVWIQEDSFALKSHFHGMFLAYRFSVYTCPSLLFLLLLMYTTKVLGFLLTYPKYRCHWFSNVLFGRLSFLDLFYIASLAEWRASSPPYAQQDGWALWRVFLPKYIIIVFTASLDWNQSITSTQGKHNLSSSSS